MTTVTESSETHPRDFENLGRHFPRFSLEFGNYVAGKYPILEAAYKDHLRKTLASNENKIRILQIALEKGLLGDRLRRLFLLSRESRFDAVEWMIGVLTERDVESGLKETPDYGPNSPSPYACALVLKNVSLRKETQIELVRRVFVSFAREIAIREKWGATFSASAANDVIRRYLELSTQRKEMPVFWSPQMKQNLDALAWMLKIANESYPNSVPQFPELIDEYLRSVGT